MKNCKIVSCGKENCCDGPGCVCGSHADDRLLHQRQCVGEHCVCRKPVVTVWLEALIMCGYSLKSRSSSLTHPRISIRQSFSLSPREPEPGAV